MSDTGLLLYSRSIRREKENFDGESRLFRFAAKLMTCYTQRLGLFTLMVDMLSCLNAFSVELIQPPQKIIMTNYHNGIQFRVVARMSCTIMPLTPPR